MRSGFPASNPTARKGQPLSGNRRLQEAKASRRKAKRNHKLLDRAYTQGNRISSCPCQYLQQVPFIETAKESFLPDAEGSGAFLS